MKLSPITSTTSTTSNIQVTRTCHVAAPRHQQTVYKTTSPKCRLTLDRPPPQTLESTSSSSRLGRRWPEYQGARNWDGLLSPLDPNIRSEILRYGYFVEAAYRSFDFDPTSPTYAMCIRAKRDLLEGSGFPDTGYKVTKNLRATSGVQMPRWTEKASSWMAMQSSWIGYVAVCTDKDEIQRLGRRDVVIALRGTATCLEWLENLRATLTDLLSGGGMVESGFLSLYTSSTDTCPSLCDTIRDEVARILETYEGEEVSFTVTGHSLGAALATLAAHDIRAASGKRVTVISFGGPRVGDRVFRKHVEERGTKILRVVNPNDLITKLPGFLVEEDEEDRDEATGRKGDQVAGWSSDWWGYAEVGRELRLSEPEKTVPEKAFSYPKWVNMDFTKCHDLKTYLSLVGSSVASNCPLRQTANRLTAS